MAYLPENAGSHIPVAMKELARRIRDLRQSLKMNQAKFAHHLGTTQPTVSRWEKQDQMPDFPFLKAMAAMAKQSVEEFIGDPTVAKREGSEPVTTAINPPLTDVNEPDYGDEPIPNEVRRPAMPLSPPDIHNWPKDLPIRGSAAGGDGLGEFYFNGETVAYDRRPPALTGVRDAFGLYLDGDSMAPLFESGDTVWVNPSKPVTPNCYVLVELRPEKGEAVGAALVKQLVRRTPEKLVLRQFNPAKEFMIPMKRVLRYYRIVPHREWEG